MGNKSSIWVSKSGQFRTGVPKSIGEMLRLNKESKLEWLYINGEIIIRKI